ncbi:PREDICTED: histidine triad nucleotide-binding protein 3-like isoform X2 [Poecilia mexicana]|uniref:histidine triad nucleotide-binding protein 3-like isoform X2 n=1 Tax=Poecilia formosa TaxID=48698 RepID=UPI0004441E18|nr:PREDICTED: histidine triad nucleotide-binding protein 3-like isoform X2 [Poecilia formosa]XP_014859959.1 PREDICTED: histidine triad nucleotide-binding protein 3-like isoform X2 [Poecilia mexicana]
MEGKTCKEFDESCIFCHFAHNRDVETTILKQDEEFVCFRDIDPVAPHHYLVIPRDHIVSCKSLNRSHIDLVERMAKFGKEVLLDQGITDMENVGVPPASLHLSRTPSPPCARPGQPDLNLYAAQVHPRN